MQVEGVPCRWKVCRAGGGFWEREPRKTMSPCTLLFLKDIDLHQNDPGKWVRSHSVYTVAVRKACPWVCGQGRRGQAWGGFGTGCESSSGLGQVLWLSRIMECTALHSPDLRSREVKDKECTQSKPPLVIQKAPESQKDQGCSRYQRALTTPGTLGFHPH